MISFMKVKLTPDNKQWVKGVCLSSDIKPVTGFANGSILEEFDTGKKCVFDEENAEWIEYGTGEDRGGGGGAKITTETISGEELSQIFFDNNWDATKFLQLANDIKSGHASALAHIPVAASGGYFEAQIMPSFIGDKVLLNTAAFAPPREAYTPQMALLISWALEPVYDEAMEKIGDSVTGMIGIYSGTWVNPATDAMINTITGQTSYSIVITHIEED